MSEPSRVDFAALPAQEGFRPDTRFAVLQDLVPSEPEIELQAGPETDPATGPETGSEPELRDPVADAYAKGFTLGEAKAQAEAAERERIEGAAREQLALSIAHLNREMEEELRQRLRDTVAALCEAAIAPLALDSAALEARVKRAVSMLARADDDRVIRLNPDDCVLIGPRLAEDWELLPDASLARGAIRIEARNGGVEDGPQQWREAITEALARC